MTSYTAMRSALATFIEYNDNGGPLSFDVDAMWANARAALAEADSAPTEVDTLRQQLEEVQSAIEASRKQEAVARFDWGLGKFEWLTKYSYDKHHRVPLYAAPVVADDVLKDAQRYRYIRAIGGISLTVLETQKRATNEVYDAATDAAMGGHQ